VIYTAPEKIQHMQRFIVTIEVELKPKKNHSHLMAELAELKLNSANVMATTSESYDEEIPDHLPTDNK
jgi:hypothetical protein